ncbi:MAG: hypothetical protein V4764_02885 [Burkholderia sp.]
MSNVIDWTKYGRAPRREQPEITITYHGAEHDGKRIWCTATFPLERADDVKALIDQQIEFWKTNP